MELEAATRFEPVADADGLDDWLPRPGLALLFLHDPGCFISRRAFGQVERVGGEAALIDVRAHPGMAGEVERRTGVHHGSWRAVMVRIGRPARAASHPRLTAGSVARAVAAARGR